MEALLEGYREIERVFFGKEPFDGVTTSGLWWPCNHSLPLQSDEDIKQWIMKNIQTTNNRVGTNRMGVVVDAQYMLNNTLNVRVVDGSVMPSLITGSVQAPIVMLAQRASDVILEAYGEETCTQ